MKSPRLQNKTKFLAALWVFLLTPLMTFGLLLIKGLPSFTAGFEGDVLLWVYQVTWLPALGSGILFSLVLVGIEPKMAFFTQPYDFGRCFSLGAIAGALAEAVSTWTYREVTHHPFSGFWIAGAMIAGSLIGSLVTPILLQKSRLKKITAVSE